MPIIGPGPSSPTGYCSIEDVKNVLGIAAGDTSSDGQLQLAIDAATGEIDARVNRTFGLSAAASDRYFTANSDGTVDVDDIGGLAGFAVATDATDDGTYEVTWIDETDFRRLPVNAAQLGQPWDRLERLRAGRYLFPSASSRVKVTARWGWPAVPPQVRQACALLAALTATRDNQLRSLSVEGHAVTFDHEAAERRIDELLAGFVKYAVA